MWSMTGWMFYQAEKNKEWEWLDYSTTSKAHLPFISFFPLAKCILQTISFA